MEYLFYHLQSSSLEQALPPLLEKSIERGWSVVVRASSQERVEALDNHLWTYREDSFLPHGIGLPTEGGTHPIRVDTDDARHGSEAVIFCVDGADLPETTGWTRIILMFADSDPEAMGKARGAWKTLKSEGQTATYWKQSPEGRWENSAST
jgi:DNA polymerase III subunit chi